MIEDQTKAEPKIKHKAIGGAALALLAALFVGLTILANYGLRGLRIDLTENHQYTLATGTRNILKSIKEPINLYYYFSHGAGEQAPLLKLHADRVRELLEELTARANGKIRLQVIDPEPFSEDEDRASEFGLTPVPLGANGEKMYFGLAGTNSTDGRATLELFQPDEDEEALKKREQFLEYDVSKLILQLANPKKPVVGLLSGLPMNADYNQETGQMRDPWVVMSQLQQLFSVHILSADLARVDTDVDVLALVHPKNLSQQALYAIDQFLMRGGRAIIFVDPQSMADPAGREDPQRMNNNPYAALTANRSSDLEPLFKAWGVEYNPKQAVGDLEHALIVTTRMGEPPVRHIGILGLDGASLNRKDVITASLSNINVATAGSFKLAKTSSLTLEPLIQTGTQAGPLPIERFMDPTSLRDGFHPTGERLVIAGRLQGRLKSAFPNGAPAQTATTNSGSTSPAAAPLKESKQPINIVLVADTDLLTDMLWVRNQSFFGQPVAQAWASNGDFIFNAIDNLAGSNDLISIRGRASFVRPFTTVEAIKRDAEERFLAKEKELEEQLRTTEQKLSELQSHREHDNRNRSDQSSLILSPEQEREVERFQQEKLRIRKELREVRHGMDQDIERLGTVIKVINIILVPVLLSVLALVAVAWRRRRAGRKT
jgi:ABC-type uncharacterized transport system involved in gliding motility auxiliary subunit